MRSRPARPLPSGRPSLDVVPAHGVRASRGRVPARGVAASRGRVRARGVRAGAVVALAGALALVGVADAAAKTLRGKATDPAGDAPSGGVDITAATTKYESAGKLRITVTTATALDLRTANLLAVTFAGKSCKADIFGVAATLSDATLPWAYRITGKAQPVNGRGTVSGNRYTATFQAKLLRGLRPAYFQAAIFPPKDKAPALDQTDCFSLR